MKILITGGSGLVGSRLIELLYEKGYSEVRVLSRNPEKTKKNSALPIETFLWDPEKHEIDKASLKDIDVIVNLAGENVADGRWSEKRKKNILSSRVNSAQTILKALKEENISPKKLINASAIGIYGSSDDKELNEQSPLGEGFLADVCKKWEEAPKETIIEGMDVKIIRIGIVLSTKGGALKKMLPPFMLGGGGILGSGKQYMSWIHIDDLVGQIIFLIENDTKNQTFNAVAPESVTNYQFTKTLGKVIKRPTIFPVPGFALKLIFGEMSEILLEGQKVVPNNFQEEGYQFQYSNLEEALKKNLTHINNGEGVLLRYQLLKKPVESIFPFFSNEKNLEEITPPFLGFKVLGKNTDEIQEGTLIDYKLKVHGIPMKWTTRINSFVNNKQFIDEQLKGPYTKWVHLHDFIKVGDKTLMKDEVVYKVPFGILGRIFATPLVKRDINMIFNYRYKIIKEKFS